MASRRPGRRLSLIDYGTIDTPAQMPLPRRLRIIHEGMGQLIEEYSPLCVALEELVFYNNVTTAIAVGHARGVLVLAAEEAGLPLFEYTPMEIKQAAVGYGHADKKQVQNMVRVLLNLRDVPKPDDAADALAIAICCSSTLGPMQHKFQIR